MSWKRKEGAKVQRALYPINHEEQKEFEDLRRKYAYAVGFLLIKNVQQSQLREYFHESTENTNRFEQLKKFRSAILERRPKARQYIDKPFYFNIKVHKSDVQDGQVRTEIVINDCIFKQTTNTVQNDIELQNYMQTISNVIDSEIIWNDPEMSLFDAGEREDTCQRIPKEKKKKQTKEEPSKADQSKLYKLEKQVKLNASMLSSDISSLETQMQHVTQQIQHINDIDLTQAKVVELTQLYANDDQHNQQINTLNGQITALQSKDLDHDSSISTITGQITALQSKDLDHDSSISTITGQITALQSKDLDHDNTITNHGNLLTNHGNSIQTLTSDLNTANGNITDLQTSTTSLSNESNQIYMPTSKKSKIICSGDNQIDIYSNDSVNPLGKLYQPVGQAQANLGILSNNKLQFQSNVSSISAYGGKPLDTSAVVLNTHGFYVTGVDGSANVQSMVGIQQGTVQLNLVAGKLLSGTKYSIISASDNITLSGGLLPIGSGVGASDHFLTIYSATNKSLLSKAGSFEFSDTCIYGAAPTLTNALQLTHKGYIDNLIVNYLNQTTGDARYYLKTTTLDAIALPVNSLNMNGKNISGLGSPTIGGHAVSKLYADNTYVLQTTPLNSIKTATGALSLGGFGINNLSTPTLSSDAATKGYVDTSISTKMNSSVTLNAIPVATGIVSLGNQRIQNLADPVNTQDAVTLSYFNANKGSSQGGVSNLSQLFVDSNLNMKSVYKITGLIEPTLSSDASTKNYIDTLIQNYYSKTQNDALLATKMSSTSNINSLALQTGDYSCNNFKLTNCATPLSNTDVANKAYVDSKVAPVTATVYSSTITTATNGAVITVNHGLNLAITQLDITVYYYIKNAVNDYSVGDVIFTNYSITDRSNNGITFGLMFCSLNDNNITMICGSMGVTTQFKTGGTTYRTAAVEFQDVNIYLYITQRASPKIMQSNSLYTSQLSINSGLNFTGYTVQANDPINGSDLVTKQWVIANTATGTPSKIQNSTTATTSLTANSTELVSTVPINMSSKKITSLANGTISTDAVNYSQLLSYTPTTLQYYNSALLKSSSLYLNTTGLRFTNYNGADIITYYQDGTVCELNCDKFVFNCLTGSNAANNGTLVQMSTLQLLSCARLKVSTSTTQQQYNAYIDDTILPLKAALYLNKTSGTGFALQVAGGGIDAAGQMINCGSVASLNVNCINVNASGVITLASSGTSIPQDKNTIIHSHTDTPGVLGFYSKNWISVAYVELYTPGSSRKYKKNIEYIDTTDLDGVDFRRFYYDKYECEQRNIKADFTRENWGVIIEELPLNVQNKYCYQHMENGAWTVDMSRLKDDVIQYHQETIRRHEQTIRHQQERIQQLETKLDMILQRIGGF